MGQAAQKAARIKALQPICVGPAPFVGASGSVAFIVRNGADAKQRMLSAVADVVSPRDAVLSIERLVRESQEEVGWIIVTYTPDGGVLFEPIVSSQEAIAAVVGWIGEGYAARKRRWSALVFGLPTDVEAIRSLVLRFRDDVEVSEPFVAPVMAMHKGFDPMVHLQIPRADVDAMNLAPALLFFDTFVTGIEVVERLTGNVVVSFSGFDDDSRFLGEIPAVDAFLRQLIFFAPWAPLVLNTSCFVLFVKALDGRVDIKTADEMTSVHAPPAASIAILDKFKWTMAEFLAARLFVNDLPACLRGTLLEWNAFLNSGPEVIPFPESLT